MLTPLEEEIECLIENHTLDAVLECFCDEELFAEVYGRLASGKINRDQVTKEQAQLFVQKITEFFNL